MKKVRIDLGEKSYDIHIGRGRLKEVRDCLAACREKIIVVTDRNVDELYGARMEEILDEVPHCKLVIEPGEGSKSMDTVVKTASLMLEEGLTRKSRVIAFGGGVVGDLAGFCASIYMRGIPFLQIPTTLLAQVDSSVGGKTGINLAEYKNSIGTFYQPEAVLIDTEFLDTLPYRELLSGIGEIVKYGLIADYAFFRHIADNIEAIKAADGGILEGVIEKCCEIKARVVSMDEREEGLRKILNFGHTLGHALEGLTDFQQYTHGEAVIIGMYYETLLAKRLRVVDEAYAQEITEFLRSLQVNMDISMHSPPQLVDVMCRDKKNRDGKISFILPTARGRVQEYLLDKREVRW